MLSINSNIMSLNAAANMSTAHNGLFDSVQRLSSGLRINSAKDDAAGLAVRELLRADLATFRQASRNASDGLSMLQVADSSSGTINDILVRMKQLATQASTGTYSAQQRNLMQQEFAGLSEQVSQITDSTSFNGINLHQAGQTVEIALGDGQTITVDTENISVDPSADLTVDPQAAAVSVTTAIEQLSTYRGSLGATSNRLESAARVIDIQAENILVAESRISDVDVAKEMAALTSKRIVVSAAVAAQSQSNTIAKVVQMLLG